MNACASHYSGCSAISHPRSLRSFAGWRASGAENHAPGLRGPNYYAAFVLGPDGKNIEAVLRRRSQFTPEPARCRARLHRIDKLDHSLMNVFTSWTLECSDVKAGRAGGDPCQHRHRFALRACWSVKHAHDVVPYIRREHRTISHRVDAREGPVMGIVFHTRAPTCWSIQTTIRKS